MYYYNLPLTENEKENLKLGVYNGLHQISFRKNMGELSANALDIDNLIYYFRFGWLLEDGPHKGEAAMVCKDIDYPTTAPVWIPTGDLICHVEKDSLEDKSELHKLLRKAGKL